VRQVRSCTLRLYWVAGVQDC